jgi:hypothetical protein
LYVYDSDPNTPLTDNCSRIILLIDYLGKINCNGGCKICPPSLNIDISGGGGGGGDDDNDDDDETKTTITKSAYTTTMTKDSHLTTITESARTTTETESESSSTETSTTLTVGFAIGTYTAFAEPSGSLTATTEPIASLQSIATILSRQFSSLYSAEVSSLTAGLYTTTTSTTSTSTSSTSTTTSTSATATPTEEFIIALAEDANVIGDIYTWEYFAPAYDASYSACDGIGEGPDASDDGSYPSGTIDIEVKVHGMSDCVYEGTSDAAGTLTCPDLSSTVQCHALTDSTTATCYTYSAPIEYTPMIWCYW